MRRSKERLSFPLSPFQLSILLQRKLKAIWGRYTTKNNHLMPQGRKILNSVWNIFEKSILLNKNQLRNT